MLTISGWQWAAVFQGFTLPDLAFTVAKSYLIGRSALIGAIALIVGMGLFTGRPWAPRWGRLTSVVIAAWLLLERLIYVTGEISLRRLPGAAILSLLIWIVMLIVLRRPAVLSYFQEHLE